MTETAYRQLSLQDVAEGDEIRETVMELTYRHCINHVGAGRDYMPGHHEPAYAKRQGQSDIFTNTLFHQSFVDRVVTDWAGPRTFIARRKMAMRGSIHPGHVLRGAGKVTRIWTDEQNRPRIDLEIVVTTQDGLATTADVSVVVPRDA